MDQNVIQVGSDLELRIAAEADFAAVYHWFFSVKEASTSQKKSFIRQWAGPNITYPCSVEQLTSHLIAGQYQSFILAEHTNIIGFGQIQLVKQRAHFARLAINPIYRGQGLAKRLLAELIGNAQQQIALKEVSLFVYMENTTAIACYEKFGFVESATPTGINTVVGCRFMTLRY
nr:GNAT family N-acetyltransferase [uncultured Glaciecola sp.]